MTYLPDEMTMFLLMTVRARHYTPNNTLLHSSLLDRTPYDSVDNKSSGK